MRDGLKSAAVTLWSVTRLPEESLEQDTLHLAAFLLDDAEANVTMRFTDAGETIHAFCDGQTLWEEAASSSSSRL